MTPTVRNRVLVLVGSGAALLGFGGCSGLLGFDDYAVVVRDAASPDNPTLDSGADGDGDAEASCNVDLSVQCYPCTPVTTVELLNACSNGDCIPFDRSRLTGLLAADGGLPSLPPPDGG